MSYGLSGIESPVNTYVRFDPNKIVGSVVVYLNDTMKGIIFKINKPIEHKVTKEMITHIFVNTDIQVNDRMISGIDTTGNISGTSYEDVKQKVTDMLFSK